VTGTYRAIGTGAALLRGSMDVRTAARALLCRGGVDLRMLGL
jgi:hypothetical protein